MSSISHYKTSSDRRLVAVIGSINTDLVVEVGKIPNPGETVLGGELKTIPGGKGANQAVAASLLGADVAMIGCVGDDSFGAMGRENLARCGVDVSMVQVLEGTASGVALISVDKAGENAIVVAPGANMKLTRQHIDAAEEVLSSAAVLVMQFEVPLDVVRYAAEKAKAKGALVAVNCAPAAQPPEGFLSLCDIVIVNESEAGAIAKVHVADHDSAAQAARKIREMGAGCVVVTLGSKGLAALGRPGERMGADDVVRLAAFSVNAVDTTAAGDTFVGGLVARFLETRDFTDALMWGSAAAAIAATRPGAQTSMPAAAEVAEFIGTRTWRDLEMA